MLIQMCAQICLQREKLVAARIAEFKARQQLGRLGKDEVRVRGWSDEHCCSCLLGSPYCVCEAGINPVLAFKVALLKRVLAPSSASVQLCFGRDDRFAEAGC
eukprot:scaffold61411_cov15-Tisochrysis_lutea.AAC.1